MTKLKLLFIILDIEFPLSSGGSLPELDLSGRVGMRLSYYIHAIAIALALAAPLASRADPMILRIGTGGVGGTYHPIGTLISQGLSDGSMPGLLVVAQSSNGSVSNVEALHGGLIELALAQSNVVDRAYRGTLDETRPAIPELRAIANIYVEALHLVTRSGLDIGSPSDLRGLTVSLDEAGSGTLGDARLVLNAFGLTETDILPAYIKPDLAISKLSEHRLDAFFIVAGTPVATIADASSLIRLVPIEGPAVDRLLARNPAYQRVKMPAGTYDGHPEVATIGVGAQLVARADLDEDMAYHITAMLWSDDMRALLDAGHPKGKEIRLERALEGIAIPLHPGAVRFYRDAGLLP